MNKNLLITCAVFFFAVAAVSFLLTDSVSDAAASVNSFQESAPLTLLIDTYVASGPNDKDQPHGNTNGLYVGYDDDPSFDLQSTRTYLQFDLTSLANKVATGPATLNLHLNFTTFESSDETMDINIHEVNGGLNNDITWDNQPSDLGDVIATQQVGTVSGNSITWTIPQNVIENWINSSAPNIGLVLISPDGETPGKHLRNFRSKEFDNGSQAPRLDVSYTDPTPVPAPPTPTPTPIPPRLSLSLENQPSGEVTWGDEITYTISYSNATLTNTTLNNVVITGTIPISTTLDRIFTSQAVSNTNEVRLHIPELPRDQGGQLRYSVIVNTPTAVSPTTKMAISTIPMMNVITTPTDSMRQTVGPNRSTITSFRSPFQSNLAIEPAVEPRMTAMPIRIVNCVTGSSDDTSPVRVCVYNNPIRLFLPMINK